MSVQMQLEKIFNLAAHMSDDETRGTDYTLEGTVDGKKRTATLTFKQQGLTLNRSLQAFMQGVGSKTDKTLGVERTIQAFEGSAELPVLTKDVFNVTEAVPVYDLLWQAAFRGIQLQKGELSWEIADVSSGLTFRLIPEFDKVDFYSLAGDKEIIPVQKYGAGLGLTWEVMEGRKLYKFVDLMLQARARLYELWANTHYALLDAAGALNITAWQGAATDPGLDRDIATINSAYESIGNAVKAKGYGEVANVQMLLFALPSRKARIMQALRATSKDVIAGRHADAATSATAGQIIEYNITPFFTWNANITAATPLLVLPGNKIQNAIYMQEMGLSERDIESLSVLHTYWTAYGATVADTDQCRRVTLT